MLPAAQALLQSKEIRLIFTLDGLKGTFMLSSHLKDCRQQGSLELNTTI